VKLTDDLVDLFIRVLKDIRLKAESREKKRLMNDFIPQIDALTVV